MTYAAVYLVLVFLSVSGIRFLNSYIREPIGIILVSFSDISLSRLLLGIMYVILQLGSKRCCILDKRTLPSGVHFCLVLGLELGLVLMVLSCYELCGWPSCAVYRSQFLYWRREFFATGVHFCTCIGQEHALHTTRVHFWIGKYSL